jgi:hypothetical protein
MELAGEGKNFLLMIKLGQADSTKNMARVL